MRRTYRCAAKIHPIRCYSKGFSASNIRGFPLPPRERWLSNGAGLKRNPARSGTDGLFTKPSTFSLKDQEFGVGGIGVPDEAKKTPDRPRPIAANAPSSPLTRKSPGSPLKRPQTNTNKHKLAPLHFCQKLRGSDTSEPREGRGDSGAPNRSALPKTMVQSEGGQANTRS